MEYKNKCTCLNGELGHHPCPLKINIDGIDESDVLLDTYKNVIESAFKLKVLKKEDLDNIIKLCIDRLQNK